MTSPFLFFLCSAYVDVLKGNIKHGGATRGGFGDKTALGWQHGKQRFVIFSRNDTHYIGLEVAKRSDPGSLWVLNIHAFQVLPIGHRLSVVIRKVMEQASNRQLCPSSGSSPCVLHVLGMRLGYRVQSTRDGIPSGSMDDKYRQVSLGANDQKNPAE